MRIFFFVESSLLYPEDEAHCSGRIPCSEDTVIPTILLCFRILEQFFSLGPFDICPKPRTQLPPSLYRSLLAKTWKGTGRVNKSCQHMRPCLLQHPQEWCSWLMQTIWFTQGTNLPLSKVCGPQTAWAEMHTTKPEVLGGKRASIDKIPSNSRCNVFYLQTSMSALWNPGPRIWFSSPVKLTAPRCLL